MRSHVSTGRMLLAGIAGVVFALLAGGFSVLVLLLSALGGMSDNCRDSQAGQCSGSTDVGVVLVIAVSFGIALASTALVVWLVLGRSRRGVGKPRLFGASAALILCTIGGSIAALASGHIPLAIGVGVLALVGWARITAAVFERKLSA